MFQCFNVSLKQNACLVLSAGFLCNIWPYYVGSIDQTVRKCGCDWNCFKILLVAFHIVKWPD